MGRPAMPAYTAGRIRIPFFDKGCGGARTSAAGRRRGADLVVERCIAAVSPTSQAPDGNGALCSRRAGGLPCGGGRCCVGGTSCEIWRHDPRLFAASAGDGGSEHRNLPATEFCERLLGSDDGATSP